MTGKISKLAMTAYFPLVYSLPIITTATITTIIAINAPFDMLNDPVSVPDAPAFESALLPWFEEFASPAEPPFPGCCGAEVAREEKTEATEADDIAGVKDTVVLVADIDEDADEDCAIAR